MKFKRVLNWILSLILVMTPFLASPANFAFAEGGETTVSDYKGLKNALAGSYTVIKMKPNATGYILEEPLILDRKVRLVGVTSGIGETNTFNNTNFLDTNVTPVINGNDKFNIEVGVNAMIENVSLTNLRKISEDGSSDEQTWSSLVEKIKTRFGEDLTPFKEEFFSDKGLGLYYVRAYFVFSVSEDIPEYLVEKFENVGTNSNSLDNDLLPLFYYYQATKKLPANLKEKLDGVLAKENYQVTPDTIPYKDDNGEEKTFEIGHRGKAESDLYAMVAELQTQYGYAASLRINGGTVQNCRIVGNNSGGKLAEMHDGTFFGNLVAFNSCESLLDTYGLSYVLNNTIVFNYSNTNKVFVWDEQQGENVYKLSRSKFEDRGQGFFVNNVLHSELYRSKFTEKYDANFICDYRYGVNLPSWLGTNFYPWSKENTEPSATETETLFLKALGITIEGEKNFEERLEKYFDALGSHDHPSAVDKLVSVRDDVNVPITFCPQLDLQTVAEGIFGSGNRPYIMSGKDVFFDKIPDDMNVVTRLAKIGKRTFFCIGAFTPFDFQNTLDGLVDYIRKRLNLGDLTISQYPPKGDVLYVTPREAESDSSVMKENTFTGLSDLIKDLANDGSSWEKAYSSPEQAIIDAARGNARTIMISGGEYTINGRVMLYQQKDGFTGGIWGGMVLPEGMKIYGGVKAGAAGTVQEQIDARKQPESKDGAVQAWNFETPTVLKGYRYNPNNDNNDNNDNSSNAKLVSEDNGRLGAFPDYTDRGKDLTTRKPFTRYFAGVRVLTQVEDLTSALVDGVSITEGYAISSKEVTPKWLPVKRVNRLGGAGALIRKGTVLKNSVVQNSYEAALYYDNYGSLADACGGGVMIAGGTLSNCNVEFNISESSGGGVFLMSGTVEHSNITGNKAFNMGGGIATAHMSVLEPSFITDTTIEKNEALGIVPQMTSKYGLETLSPHEKGKGIGGGAWIGNNVKMDKVVLNSNRAKNKGLNLYVGTKSDKVAQALVSNSLVAGNGGNDPYNPSVFMEAGEFRDSDVIVTNLPIDAPNKSKAKIAGVLFWKNEADLPDYLNVTYSAVRGGFGEESAHNFNLSDDNDASNGPKFADPSMLDLHLTSASPLLGINDPDDPIAWDYDGVSRPQGKISDIGMFEFPVSETTLNTQKTGDDSNIPYIVAVCAAAAIIALAVVFMLGNKKRSKN